MIEYPDEFDAQAVIDEKDTEIQRLRAQREELAYWLNQMVGIEEERLDPDQPTPDPLLVRRYMDRAGQALANTGESENAGS